MSEGYRKYRDGLSGWGYGWGENEDGKLKWHEKLGIALLIAYYIWIIIYAVS